MANKDRIEVEIFIDDKQADRVLAENKSKFDSFADGVGDKLGVSMSAGLAGIAAAAGTAALAAAGVFAKLVKDASDYGSIINDASQKTGLAAESISALKFNAEAAGSSLDQVTAGIAKFAKTQDPLTDLDTALDTVFKRIADARPGIEQITVAQDAFGKSGADLIPVILQAGGSFAEMKAEAERLGLTLSGDAAQAADDFGDAMGTISAQAQNAAATFALEFTPQITDGLQSISDFLADNKAVWEEWGERVSNILIGTKALIAAVPLPERLAGAAGQGAQTAGASLLLGPLYPLLQALEQVGSFVDGGAAQSILDAEKQIEKNKRLLANATRGRSPDDEPGIKGTGLAFTADEKWREANKKYFAEFQAGIKASNEAQRAADRAAEKAAKDAEAAKKRMIDESIKAAKEWAQYVKNAQTTIADTFANTSDNPFVRIWSDQERAIERVVAATGRLKGGITANLIELIKGKSAAAEFGQSLSNSLKAAGLRTAAANIANGSVEDEARRRLFANYSSPEAREAAFQNEVRRLTEDRQRRELEDQMRIINAGRSPGESAEIARQRNQAIIAATQGLNGSQLGSLKSDAVNARLDEARALEREKTEAKKLKEEEVAVLKELSKQLGTGAIVDVKVDNRVPDLATVQTANSAATNRRYPEQQR